MQIQEEHIAYIKNSLKLHGVKSKQLEEDLVGHICTYIESHDSDDFNMLYQEALQKFGGYASFQNLERETSSQKLGKARSIINKLKIATGLTMILLLVIGSLFKIMHWPYASAFLLGAILLFSFGILPLLFYDRYKKSTHKFS